jgi:hypothetical protein
MTKEEKRNRWFRRKSWKIRDPFGLRALIEPRCFWQDGPGGRQYEVVEGIGYTGRSK